MIEYDETSYKGSEIEGFFVTEMMKRNWAASLEVLLELDRICKENHIKYFLYYGSLLGAVRHKGFIPWDDDIDVGMLREDYNKFRDIAETQIRPPFQFTNLRCDRILYPCRMINTEKPCIDEAFLKRFHGCPYIVGVDIFPLDKLPDDSNKEVHEFKEIFKVVKYVAQRLDPLWDKGMLPLKEVDRLYFIEESELNEVVEGVEEYFGIKIPKDGNRHSFLAHMADELAQIFVDEECANVVYMHDMNVIDGTLKYIPRSSVENVVDMDFQGLKVPVPGGYDNVLEALYGKDWKKPIRDEASHIYPSYRRQAEILEKIYRENNVTPPEYFFL